MLAGIPQRPEAGNPINGPKWALRRRNVVLARMLDQQSITESQYQDAVQQPITARVFAREVDVPSPYVGEWVRQQTAKLIDDLYTGGYSVYTSIDSSLQQEAINALRRGLINYDRSHGYRGPEGRVDSTLIDQIIMTDTLDPETGETTSVVSVPEGFAEQALQGTRVFGQLLPAVVISVEEKTQR